jgi:hypothetical protein
MKAGGRFWFHSGFLLGVFFDAENGGDMSFGIVG